METNAPDSDADEFEPTPPTLQRVWQRFQVLFSFYWRAMMESELRDPSEDVDPDEVRATADEFIPWTRQLSGEASPQEMALLQKPLGTWTNQEVIDGSWKHEAILVMQWALCPDLELPGWDSAGDLFDDLCDRVAGLMDPAELPEGLSLRSQEEVEHEAQIVETCYWRIRMGFQLADDDRDYVLKLLGRAEELGHIQRAPGGDLLCSNGRSLADQTQDDYQLKGSICQERLRALNWLCGQDEVYDEVTADTVVGWLWDENWQ